MAKSGQDFGNLKFVNLIWEVLDYLLKYRELI